MRAELGLEIASDYASRVRGLEMHHGGRSVDVQKFLFGSLRTLNIYRRPSRVGDYSLHIQCLWRLVSRGEVIASRDRLSGDATVPDETDLALEEFFDNVPNPVVVQRIQLDSLKMITLEFSDEVQLEIVADSSDDEQWRMFEPASRRPHVVVEWVNGDLVAGLEE